MKVRNHYNNLQQISFPLVLAEHLIQFSEAHEEYRVLRCLEKAALLSSFHLI